MIEGLHVKYLLNSIFFPTWSLYLRSLSSCGALSECVRGLSIVPYDVRALQLRCRYRSSGLAERLIRSCGERRRAPNSEQLGAQQSGQRRRSDAATTRPHALAAFANGERLFTLDVTSIFLDSALESGVETLGDNALESGQPASNGGAEVAATAPGYAEGSDIGAAEETFIIDEESYAQECPILSPDDTEGYGSGDEDEDDARDGSEELSEVLPLMAMAVAAYKSSSMVESIPEGFVEKSQVIQNVMDATHLFGVLGKTDTEVHVSILEDERVVLAFRGTEPTEWSTGFADVLTDLAEWQEPVKLYDRSRQPVYSSSSDLRAHRGFQLALKDVTDNRRPREHLRLVLQGLGMQAEDVKSVVCVGHSLGGALATLCAKWCREVAFPEATIGCVTIGSPRVGNAVFALDFNSRVVDGLNYRVVNKRDVVPCVPNLLTYPKFGSLYKHVGEPIYLWEDEVGELSARLGGRRPTFINLGFFDHPGASYISSATECIK